MGISRSAYYDAPTVAPDDTAIVEAMSAIRDEFERYGWRRMQAHLRQQGPQPTSFSNMKRGSRPSNGWSAGKRWNWSF